MLKKEIIVEILSTGVCRRWTGEFISHKRCIL